MKNLFIIVTHVANTPKGDVAGPAHSVIEYLNDLKTEYVFIKHPIYGGYDSEVVVQIHNHKETIKYLHFWEKTPLRYLAEGILTLFLLAKYHRQQLIYIGVDPLNALWGNIGKKMALIKTFIFFTPDYSRTRFANKIVNQLYHGIDRICAKSADYLWSVSPRIVERRLEMGTAKAKNFLVPNSSFLYRIPPNNPTKDSDIVLMVNLSKGANTDVLLNALLYLKQKGQIYKLKIIGAGTGLIRLQNQIKKLKLEKQIILKGRMEHEDAYKELVKSRVGVAFYNQEEDWTYFCDPMKVRDYLACGLPVIMNDVPYIARDVDKYALGMVVKNITAEKLSQAIKTILANKDKYQDYVDNAKNYSQKQDLMKILNKLFSDCALR